MSDADLERTSKLLREVFPDSSVGDLDYLEWLYRQSPFGNVIQANADDEQGRLGHYAVVPIKIGLADGIKRQAALSLNTAVHSRARGAGLFVKLAQEALRQASSLGAVGVVGVANANSTPGFTGRLGFDSLGPLPVKMIPYVPFVASPVASQSFSPDAEFSVSFANAAERMQESARTTVARSWDAQALTWRLSRPKSSYALHLSEDFAAVSCAVTNHGIRVACLVAVFSSEPLRGAQRRALVAAACRFHRAPLAMHIGHNAHFIAFGLPLPTVLKPSPLNLIWRDLRDSELPSPGFTRFELIDFDAY